MSEDRAAAPAASEPVPEDADAGDRWRWTPGRVLTAGVALSLVALWAYVMYLAFVPGRQPPLDRLDDPAFAAVAEVRCAAAVDEVSLLPLATEARTPADRADVLDDANAVFASMLDDLDANVTLVPAGEQRDRASAWLADWRVFLDDREDFADRLRDDPSARMLVSEKPGTGRHVTGWIDEFAKANRMPSCASPSDA